MLPRSCPRKSSHGARGEYHLFFSKNTLRIDARTQRNAESRLLPLEETICSR